MEDNEESFEIFIRLLRTYLPLLGSEPVDRSDDLADLGLDSYSAIEILMQLEEVFDVRLPDQDVSLETFSTVGSLWSVLTRTALERPVGPAPENHHHRAVADLTGWQSARVDNSPEPPVDVRAAPEDKLPVATTNVDR